MESQMTRAHGHHYDQDPLHPSVEGDVEHHEKKSVLKKVKAKAKKIKDTLTSHGHGHEHNNDHDGEEEYDEDEEIVNDPEVHGAPMYESAAAKNFVSGQEANPGQPWDNLGPKSHLGENPNGQNVCPGTFQTKVNDPDLLPPPMAAAPRNFGYDQETPVSPKRFGAGYESPFYESPLGTGQEGKSSTVGAFGAGHEAPHTFGTGHDVSSTGLGNYGAGHDTARRTVGLGDEKSGALGHLGNLGAGYGAQNTMGAGHDVSSTGLGNYGAGHDSTRKNFGVGHDEKSGTLGHFAKGHDARTAALSEALDNVSAGIGDPRMLGTTHDSLGVGSRLSAHDAEKPKVTFGEHLGEDPNMPRSGHQDVSPANYQTKVTDPGTVGAQEVGVTPILHSFDKMKIYDEPRHEKKETTTGSHDQFAPSPSPDSSSYKIDPIPENAQSVPESFNARSTENYPQDMNVDSPTAERPTGYTDKISSVTSAIAGKAISAKNAVASKIGYGGTADNSSTGSQTDKDQNMVSAGMPIGSTERFNANEPAEDPSKHQTTYTEKLSSATSALADKAVSAKNVVASKLGYGGSNTANSAENTNAAVDKANTAPTASEVSKGDDTTKAGGGMTGYGKQIASTVTGKLAPVYGTVAGAGSAVLSKIPGTGMGTGGSAQEGSNLDTDTSARTKTGSGAGETDKGVVSMKGYIADKFKPGDEDKALSDVISGALHKRKAGDEEKREVRAVVSDAVHKRNNDDEDTQRENRPMGKVTESEEVANRLGSSDAERAGKVSGDESPGTGVVDKFKGAFTNWFGKGGEMNPSQAIFDRSPDKNEDHEISREGAENLSYEGGGRRLQEPTSS